MRLLTLARSVLVCAIAVLAVALTATQSVAHPPTDPDHGVNETTYYTLWAEDVDAPNETVLRERVENDSGAMAALAAGTDVPLDSPPKAVERWNQGDLHDFPETSADTSYHPPNATLTDRRFVKDAYAAVFAVQPSTRARLSPTDQPLYVASNGTLLGTVDYRVAVPPDDVTGDRRVYWSLDTHRITETRLAVNDTPESNATGTHTPQLSYELTDNEGTTHSLTLAADITVVLRKRIEVCAAHADGHCRRWTVRTEYLSETITVRDTRTVVEYDLTISGYRTQYPNGDLGLVGYTSQPWLGYSLPNGSVRGVWRFYAAGDRDWTTLVRRTADGETTDHSPLHPVQVNAYPIETGPTPSPRRTVSLLEAYGTETQPPQLPRNVALDVLTEPYTASYGIATRTKTTDHNLSNVTAHGLVRGVETTATPSSFATVSVSQSNLSLAVLNATEETVTIRVTLTDANTGVPISTSTREGSIILQGKRVNTTENGTVVATIPRPAGGISARYEPGRWWIEDTGYVGDSDVVYVHGTVIHALAVLYELAVPVALFLLGVFLIDRITGWRIWPPWRRL